MSIAAYSFLFLQFSHLFVQFSEYPIFQLVFGAWMLVDIAVPLKACCHTER
jgi:hypothetical protein